LLKAGQMDWANQAFNLAIQAAQEIEDAWDRSWALREIAKALAEVGQLERAVEVAETIEDDHLRSQTLAAIKAAKRGDEGIQEAKAK